MTSLKALLELSSSDDYQRDFQALQAQVLPLMNQLAQENAKLKAQVEETNPPLNMDNDSKWPDTLSPHPANANVPIRKKGRNGRTWEYYAKKVNEAGFIDDLLKIMDDMFQQGFLDTDVLDAIFSTVDNQRRLSLHNYNGLLILDA